MRSFRFRIPNSYVFSSVFSGLWPDTPACDVRSLVSMWCIIRLLADIYYNKNWNKIEANVFFISAE